MSSTSSTKRIDVQQLIDSGRFTGYQFLVAFLCFVVIALDGFDTAIIGFIAPSLKSEWGLSPTQLGPLLSAGLVGLAAGSFVAGPLADRIGRKMVLVLSVLFFGIWSLASAYTDSLAMLAFFRFLTGLGLGGAMPNAITLTSEYAPTRTKSVVVTIMFCGFTLGSGLGGVLAAHMIPAYGWRSVLLFGGYVPMVFAVVLLFLLPESVRFLVLRRPGSDKIKAIIRRITPTAKLEGASFYVPESPSAVKRSPVAQLFAKELSFGTMALWGAFFMSLLIVYLLTNWLPTLFKDAGFPIAKAAMVAAMYQVGGTVGAIVLGWAMDRYNAYKVLGISYLTAILFIALISFQYTDLLILNIAVFGVGFCISGSQIGANALAASFYPTSNRATGVSWALGIGRCGAILGSMMGGALLGAGLGFSTIIMLLAVPALLASIAIYAMYGKYANQQVRTAVA
ncbi:MFS transporter [Massilia sp. Mn16-1_5]|uniref:MFS transporter n=1 Tax=Massilia sp. Mn16-1_5 TaxID=2079199 RepID=UPI00109EC488|nr:MFS transporter [Massilia sp. Mn16-1_5]THC45206.1 aromatic acid/H+ symport family MFS transporter [Massilia sp. Mn16-1_5]